MERRITCDYCNKRIMIMDYIWFNTKFKYCSSQCVARANTICRPFDENIMEQIIDNFAEEVYNETNHPRTTKTTQPIQQEG